MEEGDALLRAQSRADMGGGRRRRVSPCCMLVSHATAHVATTCTDRKLTTLYRALTTHIPVRSAVDQIAYRTTRMVLAKLTTNLMRAASEWNRHRCEKKARKKKKGRESCEEKLVCGLGIASHRAPSVPARPLTPPGLVRRRFSHCFSHCSQATDRSEVRSTRRRRDLASPGRSARAPPPAEGPPRA